MEYDELDQYVDQLFRQDDPGSGEETLYGDVLSGDLRSDRIDQIIQEAYDEVIRWHNQQISEGTDPQSGLHGLPYVPWDERIDGVAAMQGAIGGFSESSFDRNGGNWRQYGNQSASYVEVRDQSIGCMQWAVIALIVLVLLLYMMVTS
jgi:hypothetical protein